MRALFLFTLFLIVAGPLFGQELRIVDRPIVWDSTRARLSLEYLEKRHGIVQSEPVIAPRMVVVHWTAIPTLEGSFRAFDPVELRARPELVNASTLNVSVPYLVDRDGTVYRLMPDSLFGRHCIGLNYMAIGIENVGDGRKHKLTKAQLEANVLLIRQLFGRYPIEYLIGHHEYLRFKTTELWKETDPNYFTNKVDPGKKFMRQLRKRLKDLKPLGPPR
ncbi:MAG: N-acetylmuramoyl-L-alanine amidase [Saprospiraceae bacterium]|nr:N-acetylmuramoyl-L-alanine amidase [Saprospiraceae bacterium]HRD80323.1 peptidoglycan recognition family protein [Saprospiraceae bacterium]